MSDYKVDEPKHPKHPIVKAEETKCQNSRSQ